MPPMLLRKSNEYYLLRVWVCRLITQHAKRTRSIILSSVACRTLQYFSTLPHIGHDILEKSYWTQNVFWFSLKLLPLTFLILRRSELDIIKNIYWSSCEVVSFLPDFYETLISLQIFEKNILKFYANVSQWETSYFIRTDWQTNRQTYVTKIIIHFYKITNGPKIMTHSVEHVWLQVTVPAENKFNSHCELSLTKSNSFPPPRSTKSEARLDAE